MGVCRKHYSVMQLQQNSKPMCGTLESDQNNPSSLTNLSEIACGHHLGLDAYSTYADECNSMNDQTCKPALLMPPQISSYNPFECNPLDKTHHLQLNPRNVYNKDEHCPPRDQSDGAGYCAGCSKPIQARYFLAAADKKWHIGGCLQCCICQKPLEETGTCYSKDNKIYCKVDYFRIFGAKRCSRCNEQVMSSELVMRARHLVFHVRCFCCEVCNITLNKGDQYGIRNSSVFCRLHYEKPIDQPGSSYSYMSPTFNESFPFGAGGASSSGVSSSLNEEQKMLSSFFDQHADVPQQTRQKGRPRKRKHKDLEGMTSNLDLNSEYLELGFSRDCLSSSSRAKRMRTSFKHHQLRAMKSYFAINHNPDAKDLKQLSQKTGLPKRVLQVWFQNARAKFRRMMSKQEGKSFDSEDFESFSSPVKLLSGGTSPASNE